MVSQPKVSAKKAKDWCPNRQDIIWIDCNPQAGQEMRDLHPFLVLSPAAFNLRTSIVIGLPMTTAAYNADNPFAVAVATVTSKKADKTSFVLCHQPKSFDWRARHAAPHPLKQLDEALFAQCCARLSQIIELGK